MNARARRDAVLGVTGALLLAVVLVSRPPPLSGEDLARCPRKTKPMRTADPRNPWACVLIDERYRDGVDCPEGTEAVTTADPYDPFKCALSGVRVQVPRGVCPPGHRSVPTSDPGKDHECEKATKTFDDALSCPSGTKPVPTPGALTPFRCVAERALETDPSAPTPKSLWEGATRAPENSAAKVSSCPKGTRRQATEDPFNPFECVPEGDERSSLYDASYRRYEIHGEVSFEVPVGWKGTDAWVDDPPTVYFLTGGRRAPRPVSLSVSRQRNTSPEYQPMDFLLRREKEWHGAKEEKGSAVGGRSAVHLQVPGESNTAFIRMSDGYFVVSYSAPPALYERHLPAYRRLLSSLRILSGKQNGKVLR